MSFRGFISFSIRLDDAKQTIKMTLKLYRLDLSRVVNRSHIHDWPNKTIFRITTLFAP